jgi:hypothetical protein
MAGLSILPVELLELVLRYLEDDGEIGYGPFPDRSAWQASRNPFRNLILGHPRSARIVEPFLYRHIGIWTEHRLVKLMVRVLQDPSVGKLIRHVRCELDVSEGAGDTALLSLDLEMLENIFNGAWSSDPLVNLRQPLIDDIDEAGFSEMLHDLVHPFDSCRYERAQVWSKVLLIILSHTPSIESLTVHSSEYAVHREVSPTFLMFHDRRPFPGRPWQPEFPHFLNLRSVTVKPNRFWGHVSARPLAVILGLPSIHRLEVHDDDGWEDAIINWSALPPMESRLEELLLYHSRIREGALAELCLRLPNLSYLHVHFSMWYLHDETPRLTLNEVLPRLPLRSLTLLRRNPGHFIDSWPHRLTCLKTMKLEHLSLDFKGLFGPVSIGTWPVGRLEELLPTCLVQLDILADWSNQLLGIHGAGQWYWSLLRSQTRQAAQLRVGPDGMLFAKLRRFSITIPDDEEPPNGLEDRDIDWRKVEPGWFEDWDTS